MASLREGLMLEGGGVVSLVGGGGKTSLMFKLAHELASAGQTVLTTTTTKILEPSQDQSSCLILAGSVPSLLERADDMLIKHLHLTAAAAKLPESGKLCGFRPETIGFHDNPSKQTGIPKFPDGLRPEAAKLSGFRQLGYGSSEVRMFFQHIISTLQ